MCTIYHHHVKTRKRRGLCLLPFLLLNLVVWVMPNYLYAQDENVEAVENGLNELFPEKFKLSALAVSENGNGEKVLSGNVSFFGSEQTNLSCVLEGKSLKEVRATFPSSAGFDMSHVQRICGNDIRDFLPQSISSKTGIQISDFFLKIQSKKVQELNLNLKSNNWNFMSFGSLKMENVLFGIVYAPQNTSKITGTLIGDIVLSNLRLNTTMSIPTKKEDWKIIANYQGANGPISLGDIIRSIGGDELVTALLTPEFSAYFSKQTIPSFKIEASPFKKELVISTDGSAGAVSMFISGIGSKPTGYLMYSPPTNFKFAELNSSIAWLDGIKMPLSEVKLVIGNQPVSMGTHRIAAGLGIQSKILLPKEIENLLGSAGTNVQLFGQVGSLNNFTIGVDLNLNADLGSGIKMEKVGLGLKSQLAQKQFFVDGKMLLPVDSKTNIRFGLKVGVEPTSSSFIAGLNMEAVNDKNDVTEWQEPFGVPYVGISNLGGEAGLNPTTIVKSFALNGDLRLGKIPTDATDKRLKGTVVLGLDITNPTNSTIKGTLANASFAQVIEAFDPSINLSGPVRKALASGIEDLLVDIRPTGAYVEVSGSISIFGKKANLKIKADKSSGLAASGIMDPIVLKAGSFTILGITGIGNDKPTFNIDLKTDPKINIKGAIEILGKKTEGDIVLSKEGFSAKVEGSLFGGLNMKATLTGGSLDDMNGMSVSLELQQEVLDKVKTAVTAFINKTSGDAHKEIKKAQDKLSESKRNANDAEKFFLDIGDGFLGAVNEVQGVAAVAGMAITKGVLDGFNVKSIKFAGSANSLNSAVKFAVEVVVFGSTQNFDISVDLNTADAASFVENIGKEIGKGVLDGLDFLGGEWDGMKGELKEFAQQFTKVLGKAVEQIDKAFNEAAHLFEGLAKELDNIWNGEDYDPASSAGALAEMKPGIRHYSITIERIVIDKADDGISPGGLFTGDSRDKTLELYGPISIHIQGQTFSPSGTNGIFWSLNRGTRTSIGEGGVITVNNTKHFYAKEGTTIYADIISRLWEYDDGAKAAADDKIYGSALITVSNGSQPIKLTCIEGSDHPTQITIYGNVTAHPVMTAQDVRNAILSDNVNTLKGVLHKGGNLADPSLKPLDEAVNNNKLNMVDFFLANGYKPTTAHLTTAINSGSYNRDLVKRLLIRGAAPTDELLDKMIKKQDKELVAQMVERGRKPNLGQYNWLISQKNYVLAGYLLDNGVAPTFTELKTAVDGKDTKATTLVLNKGVKADINLLNQTIKNNDLVFFNLLVPTCVPQQSSLLEAAQANSTPMFKAILSKGLTVQEGAVLVYAIDRDNVDITKLALENGANATGGLLHALSNKKKNFIDLCLSFGANPNEAIAYAVTNSDLNFAKELIVKYGASGDKLLLNAISGSKLDFARLALTEGKANPSLQLKAVTSDKMDEPFANLLLDFGADPNLGMEGTIKNIKPILLARLINLGADVRKPEYVKVSSEKKSLEMLRLLVGNGASPDPGMEFAVKSDLYDIISYLLSQGAKTKGYVGMAVLNGKINTVSLILKYGGDANEGMKHAVEQNMKEITLMLLEYGASPKGYLPFPSEKGYIEIVTHLVHFGANPQEGLLPGANGNQTGIVKFLLKNGAVPKDVVKIPAAIGNLEMVQDLCQYGDDPQTGMAATAQSGHVPVAKILVSFGANPKPYEYIKLAVTHNRYTMVSYLIEQGADPNELNANNESLLHLGAAILGGNLTLKALLDGGAVKNIATVENKLGNTPLHVAVHVKSQKGHNNLASVQLLVEAGANVNSVNRKTKKGRTVLGYALNPKIKKYLKDSGAFLLVKKANDANNLPTIDNNDNTKDEEEEEEEEEE